MKFILPLILFLVGSGAGVGAGIFLSPKPIEPPQEDPSAETEKETSEEKPAEDEISTDGVREYVDLSNQFVIPIVQNKKISSMVVLSLSVEVTEGNTEKVYETEPRLRDAFLRALFDFSNIGGFDGAFTDNSNLDILRRSLRDTGRKTMGKDVVTDVLISEIARQDY